MRAAGLSRCLVVLAVTFLAHGAAAQEEPEVDCANAMTQFDMNYCAYKDYETADAALNAAYKETMKAKQAQDKELLEIDPNLVGAVDALKKAQRAWITYRDGQCELAGFEARGGTMEPMLVSGCLATLTDKRTQELKDLLQEN